jgi:hypothetical protein
MSFLVEKKEKIRLDTSLHKNYQGTTPGLDIYHS